MKIYIRHASLSLLLTFLSLSLFAQIVGTNGVPRDTSYTIDGTFAKEKKYRPFIQKVDTILPNGITANEKIVYKKISPKRDLTLSVYRPDDNLIRPVVMMIHGGGWNSGTPDMQKALAVNLARKGFATVTVEYRLIPEALYPAAVDDLNDAVKWLYQNAGKYMWDKEMIVVSGSSAGGQLAALIGTKNNDNLIKAVINLDGISTFIDGETVQRAEKAKLNTEKLPVDAQWLGGVYSARKKVWEDASALYWVHEKSAPVCFINSSIPRFHNGRDEHIRKLDSLNIYSEVHEFDDSPHTFWHFHPWHLSTVNYMASFLDRVFGNQSNALDKGTYDIVVAQDGSGDFTTVQQAIDAVPDFRKQPTKIFIRNGFYHEKIVIPETKQDLHLVGEDKFKTIISYNNFASKQTPIGGELGTSGSASIYISPDNFSAENLTFENAAGPVGQAVAVIVRSDKAKFINCRFLGFQDTLYTHKPGSKQYYQDCYIEGTVDFIFGSSTAFFEDCDIFCKRSGYVTAASTPEGQPFGYVFQNCKIYGDNPNSFFLGRPWRPYAHVAFIGCELGNVVKPEGWNNWGRESNEKTAKYVEIANVGEGADTSRRVSWSHHLSSEQSEFYSKTNVLNDEFF